MKTKLIQVGFDEEDSKTIKELAEASGNSEAAIVRMAFRAAKKAGLLLLPLNADGNGNKPENI